MPATSCGLFIDPQGRTVDVSITTSSGATATLYTAENGSTAFTFPTTISSVTGFYAVSPGTLTVSVTLNGQEIAGPSGAAQPVALSSGSFVRVNAVTDLAELTTASLRRSQFATPYVPVADRTAWMRRTASASNGTDTGINSRFSHTMLCTARNLVISYGNFFDNNGVETNGANSITVRCSIESPSGTFFPLFFNGARDAVIAPGASAVSDPLGITLAKGAQFWTRTFCSVTAGGTWPDHQATASAGNEGSSRSNGETDKTTTSTITNSTTQSFCPSRITGIPSQPGGTVIGIIGDSIAGGTGDSGASTSGQPKAPTEGFVTRALNQQYAYVTVAAAGDAAGTAAGSWATTTNIQRRLNYLDPVTHLIVALGANSTATSQADLDTLWALLSNRFGVPIYACTIPPHTTSTDSFATTANQTVTATEAARIATNAHIRATPSPLSGYFEIADQLETARDSGFWKSVGSGAASAYTSDGIHPLAIGHTAAATAISTAAFGAVSV